MTRDIKQCLIVYCGSAVPFSGILGIIFFRIGSCPAGTIFFPGCLIFCQHIRSILCVFIVYLYRDPCWLPIEYADTFVHFCDGIDHLTQFLRLSVEAEIIIHACIVTAFADGVCMTVTVL